MISKYPIIQQVVYCLTVKQVFVQCDSDLMLARRIQRDVKERGRSVDGVIEQYVFFSVRIMCHGNHRSRLDIFAMLSPRSITSFCQPLAMQTL